MNSFKKKTRTLIPLATASLAGLSNAAEYVDSNPIDWNRTSNLMFDKSTDPNVFDLKADTYNSFQFSATNPSKKFKLAATDYDQDIGAIFYQTILLSYSGVINSEKFFDITVNDAGGNSFDCIDIEKAQSMPFGTINCNQQGVEVVFTALNQGNNPKYAFVELLVWPNLKINPTDVSWMPKSNLDCESSQCPLGQIKSTTTTYYQYASLDQQVQDDVTNYYANAAYGESSYGNYYSYGDSS